MGAFNPCVFNEDVFNTGGSCGSGVCTNIITEDGILIITEDGLELVTEDSVCPPVGEGTFDHIVRIGFPFEPISGMASIGSSTTIGG